MFQVKNGIEEYYYSSQGLSIVGYFHANERFDDLELGVVAKNIADHVYRCFPQAAVLLLDNKKLGALRNKDKASVLQADIALEVEMVLTSGRRNSDANSDEQNEYKRINYSIFELPSNFFDSFRFIELLPTPELTNNPATTTKNSVEEREVTQDKNASSGDRWTCNTCKSSFESLHDQRSHFKSDFHLFNIKLSVAGKDTIREDDFAEWNSNSIVIDYDISSISGSENEENREFDRLGDSSKGLLLGSMKQKLFVRLLNGETISFWKCLLLGDSEKILFEHDLYGIVKDDNTPCVTVMEVTERLLNVIHEPRNNTCLRLVLLASGGHFVGCVFDGNSIVAHKTFHRYVIRAKSGKKQSSEDGSGKISNSAGASIRRHNELALKKEIQELLAAWKPYFDTSISIFIHAPSHNRKLLFSSENPLFTCQKRIIKHIPLTVKRPTFKEAQRLYKILTQITTEPNQETIPITKKDQTSTLEKQTPKNNSENCDVFEDGFLKKVDYVLLPLHEASKGGNVDKVMELLEQGLDPCVVDERGRTPYMVAVDKEVRNVFRRFMATNFEKWDWEAAKVPSPLSKEMEESQNAKLAKKDAKRKARAKKLKLQRKAKEKKAQEDAKNSGQGTHRISGKVAGVLVLVIGSLMAVAFGQMGRGRARKN